MIDKVFLIIFNLLDLIIGLIKLIIWMNLIEFRMYLN